MNTKSSPPKFAGWLLKLFLSRKEDFEKLGDLEEGFWIKVDEEGITKARIWYWIQIVLAIPVSIKNSITWGGIMFRNYYKIAIRNITKYRAYSAINILGLAAGMACCILILLWVQDELSYDTFHKNKDDIYKVISIYDEEPWGLAPWALKDLLLNNYPEIEKATWYRSKEVTIRYERNLYSENLAFASPSFFEIFTFPLKEGNPASALQDINSVVISEKTARKYFGSEEPMGKVITLENRFDMTVTGVIQNVPANSHLQFDLIARPDIFFGKDRLHSWIMDSELYIQLLKGINPNSVLDKITNIVNENDNGEWDGNLFLDLHPFSKIHLYALSGTDPITNVYIFTSIAIIVLLIASINFMNLSTARSATRSKEIGMRKVIGAKRKDVVYQFFAETIILSFISMLIALILVNLFLPSFNALADKQLTFDIAGNTQNIIGIITISLFTGIVSGTYPSLYLSSFQPITIFKNTVSKKGRSRMLRRCLIVFQFSAAIILIISTTVILKQMNYIKNTNLGFDRDNIITMKMDKILMNKYEALKQGLLLNQNIINVTAASSIPLNTDFNSGVYWEGLKSDESQLMNFVSVDYDYFETFNMQLKSGRSFSREYPSDMNNYIINEAALKVTGFNDPIGKLFALGANQPGPIIGIVKDFHGRSLHNTIQPTVFVNFNYAGKRNLFIKVSNGDIPGTIEYIRDIIKTQSPNSLFNYRFINEDFDRMYKRETNLQNILEYFTALAVFISCLGLIGLASFMAEKRSKEIAIRKVLGAKTPSLIAQLSKEFVILVFAANLIAWPIAYFVINGWLNEFAYKTEINLIIFILSGVIALAFALLSSSYQAYKAASVNPIKSLKYE